MRVSKKPKRDRRRRGPLPAPAEGTVRHFFETVYVPRVLTGRSPGCIEDYRRTLWALHKHYRRDITLAEQSDQLAAEHFQWLLDRGLKPSSVNHYKASWFAVWRYAHRLKLVKQKPTIKALPTTREEPDSWTVEEILLLLDNCDSAWPRPIAGIPAGDLWRALISTTYYSALRKRALLELRRADLDLKTGLLRVRADCMKNGRGQSFYLGGYAIEAVLKIWEPVRELLFPFPRCDDSFYRQFGNIVAAAGVPRGNCSKNAMHKIRRSTATQITVAKGIDGAQQILGHSRAETTKRYVGGFGAIAFARLFHRAAAAAGQGCRA